MKAAASRVRRVNITLEEETLGLIDRVAPKAGFNRSRFLEAAARYFARRVSGARLRKSLEEGYAARARRDLELVEEWFTVDEEAWNEAEARRGRKRK